MNETVKTKLIWLLLGALAVALLGLLWWFTVRPIGVSGGNVMKTGVFCHPAGRDPRDQNPQPCDCIVNSARETVQSFTIPNIAPETCLNIGGR